MLCHVLSAGGLGTKTQVVGSLSATLAEGMGLIPCSSELSITNIRGVSQASLSFRGMYLHVRSIPSCRQGKGVAVSLAHLCFSLTPCLGTSSLLGWNCSHQQPWSHIPTGKDQKEQGSHFAQFELCQPYLSPMPTPWHFKSGS